MEYLPEERNQGFPLFFAECKFLSTTDEALPHLSFAAPPSSSPHSLCSASQRDSELGDNPFDFSRATLAELKVGP